jgi:hypothetical protein
MPLRLEDDTFIHLWHHATDDTPRPPLVEFFEGRKLADFADIFRIAASARVRVKV